MRNNQYYDEDEARTLTGALVKMPLMQRMLCTGMLLGGFRRSELLDLERSDINFDDNTILIKKTTKSKNSIKTVQMPKWYMNELQLYLNQC